METMKKILENMETGLKDNWIEVTKQKNTENGAEAIFKGIRTESSWNTNEKCAFRLKEHF